MWQEYRRQKVLAQMSDRELAVLNGIMRGDRDWEIAVHLGISHSVVRQSGVALRRKLKAKSRTEVAMRALELGFGIDMSERQPFGH